jgi:ABC-type bacteriocin/lantibiotic exporter with double-glycine peptidase domain
LALAADNGVMTYLKMMLWLAVWMAGVPLVFSAIIAAIYIFTGPAANPLN